MIGRFGRLWVVGQVSRVVTNGLALAVLAAMMGLVSVEAINVGLSETIMPVGSVSALAGKGLIGGRHFSRRGAQPGRALTLIEAEVLEDAGLTGAESRGQRTQALRQQPAPGHLRPAWSQIRQGGACRAASRGRDQGHRVTNLDTPSTAFDHSSPTRPRSSTRLTQSN